jgi:hypothetical protein
MGTSQKYLFAFCYIFLVKLYFLNVPNKSNAIPGRQRMQDIVHYTGFVNGEDKAESTFYI